MSATKSEDRHEAVYHVLPLMPQCHGIAMDREGRLVARAVVSDC